VPRYKWRGEEGQLCRKAIAGNGNCQLIATLVVCKRFRHCDQRLLRGAGRPAEAAERSVDMAGGKTFKRDQKRRKEMARKLKQEEKLRKKMERREAKKLEEEAGTEPATERSTIL
jgi:hypothetical protein